MFLPCCFAFLMEVLVGHAEGTEHADAAALLS